MKAILIKSPGGPEVLEVGEAKDPHPGPGEILIRTRAVGLNGADLLQRRGLYPVPAGASEILGLECAGIVVAAGDEAAGKLWAPGSHVMALLSGGGYAEKVVVKAAHAMAVPRSWTDCQASGTPEVFLTAYLELVMLGEVKAKENVLIHAGASGVGTAAIQIARELGARVLTTASSSEKLEKCRELGAQVLINYREAGFDKAVLGATEGKGADVILDLVGGAHWAQNMNALALGGRLLLVGLGGGAKVEVDLRQILSKRAKIIGSTLRGRSDDEKTELVRRFRDFAEPRFADGRLVPVIDRSFPFEKVIEAHEYLESKANIGKVILKL